MPTDDATAEAMAIGRAQAREVLAFRAQARQTRSRALEAHPSPMRLRVLEVTDEGATVAEAAVTTTAGVLIAEGDSWFDYPFYDILAELEDRHGYDVESVAHHGDPIEEMAYGGNQLEEFSRRIEKVVRRGVTPTAILLSGGGNDIAGTEFGMLLNHAESGAALAGLNISIVEGVINQRIYSAFVTIIAAVTKVCQDTANQIIPILLHGYDYPVPDGRGFLGGWGPLPGPWLEPGFRQKGFLDLQRRTLIARDLIERFNAMVAALPTLPDFQHVRYVDLRNTLPTDAQYQVWWENELHPTERGFRAVAEKFDAVLKTLP